MNKFDVSKAINRAKSRGISPYTEVKRDLNYGESNAGDRGRCCKKCREFEKVHFPKIIRLQCRVIGICNDRFADIKEKCICKFFKRR